MNDTDGLEEAIEGQLRVLIQAAAQVGEQVARAREQAARRAEARSDQERRELESRFKSQQQVARVELRQVYRNDWWERAAPEHIGHSYQVALAWANEDPEARQAAQRISDELYRRYGIDAATTGADPQLVQDRVQAELNHRLAYIQQMSAETEQAEAQRLIEQANHQDRQADQDRAAATATANPDEREQAILDAEQHTTRADQSRETASAAYDSQARRADWARDLEAKGIEPAVVDARVRADVGQARPATEAVSGTQPTQLPKARPTRGRGFQAQRDGLAR